MNISEMINIILYLPDMEKPVFSSCPADIEVIAAKDGTATVNFTVPQATDNSGIEPTMTTSPLFLESPYVIKEVCHSLICVLIR